MTPEPWITVSVPSPISGYKLNQMMNWCDSNLGTRRIAWDYDWYHSAFDFPSASKAALFSLTWL